MEFVDRNKEQKRLEKAFGSETSKFVVMYGRRRLGKSTLLKRVINEHDIYFEAGRQETQVHITSCRDDSQSVQRLRYAPLSVVGVNSYGVQQSLQGQNRSCS